MSELEAVIAQINAQHGEGTAHRASQRMSWQHIPLDIFIPDLSLCGGIVPGLATMFMGWQSGGKTTMALKAIAAAQRYLPDHVATLIDLEGTYDPLWGAKLGVDNDALLILNPASGEDAADQLEAVVRAQETSLVVLDSIAAMSPIREIEASMSDNQIALQSKLVARLARILHNAFLEERKRDHMPAVVVINQWRMKAGVSFGDPRVLPGGKAQDFCVSVKMEVMNKPIAGKGEGGIDIYTHNEHSVKIHKNKVGNSLQTGEFKMIRDPLHPLGEAFIDEGKTVATYARRVGLITGGGSAYRIDGVDEKLRGIQGIIDYLYADPDFFREFKLRVVSETRGLYGLPKDGWLIGGGPYYATQDAKKDAVTESVPCKIEGTGEGGSSSTGGKDDKSLRGVVPEGRRARTRVASSGVQDDKE